jgi:TetR/AcrR family tetracycline transcriptional repressor
MARGRVERRSNNSTKRTYGDISIEQIVSAALTLIERDGASKLSMRRLAEHLNLSPMAAYYYVQNKDALLDRTIDQVIGPVHVPAEGTWEDKLRNVTRSARAAIIRYPELARVMQQRTPTTEQQRLAHETMGLVGSAGLERADATKVAHVLLNYLFGSLSREALNDGPSASKARGNHESEFDFGLELLIEGIKASGLLDSRKRAAVKARTANRAGNSSRPRTAN